MNLYTRKTVNILSIILTILFFLIINKIDFQIFNINNVIFKIQEKFQEISKQNENFSNDNNNDDSQNILAQNETNLNSVVTTMENEKSMNEAENINNTSSDIDKYDWCISIPIIELIAPIEETVEKDVMARSVGHFPNTSKWNGNVGLGAHNRGYPVNYFGNIKKLRTGDTIFYKYNGKIKQYSVSNIVIIKDTDWSYLEKTEENKITLITCVENEPNYRRCIQGIEQ